MIFIRKLKTYSHFSKCTFMWLRIMAVIVMITFKGKEISKIYKEWYAKVELAAKDMNEL